MRSRLAFMGEGRYSVPDSRSVRSVWVWRGFLMMSFVALGLALVWWDNGLDTFAMLWVVIAVGWFGISMWLWRQHTKWEDAQFEASKKRK
jgi:hypothetical protein